MAVHTVKLNELSQMALNSIIIDEQREMRRFTLTPFCSRSGKEFEALEDALSFHLPPEKAPELPFEFP